MEESNLTTLDNGGLPVAAADGAKTQMSSSKRSAGPAAASLKPLNHTPVIKKAATNLIKGGHSTFTHEMPNKTEKPTSEMRKTQLNMSKKKTSLTDRLDQTPQLPRRETSQDNIIQEEGVQSITSNTNAKARDRDRDKSPNRQLSLERPAAQGAQGGGFKKDLRDYQIVAQSYNAEPYYRRAMKRLGWKQVAATGDPIQARFHVRFDIEDLQNA